ncbi:substrate-binding domain-containing protein [Simiduia curdlanivorans]|uniref:Substrate-binding domain-containing protein n=1 Tax=Simiduia curdlanivorans TaxID=1492769 RepID=A0ABV8UZE1_9GAMM|nr:substrate-binding domain-containing protein [Simiduia curdlanivorans]MDN3640434.1 substrate-binding domain-containing protein [Simiduia curdlanivorans]
MSNKPQQLRNLICSALGGIWLTFSPLALADNPTLAQGLLFTAKGSNTVGAELVPQMAEHYLQSKGLVNISRQALDKENEYRVLGFLPNQTKPSYIDIAAHGSSTAFEGLDDHTADIGMSSRRIKSEEVQKLKPLGEMESFAAEKVIAIDGLAIIVHPQNRLDALTSEQVAKIFSGEISHWDQLGAGQGEIVRYARDENSGTWDTFKNLVLGKLPLANGTARFESNDELSKQVANNLRGIGFVGLAAVNKAKALAIYNQGTEPMQPTKIAVATEDYLLSRRLYLYLSPNSSNPYINDFIHFAQGQAGQAVVENVGYVSQNPSLVKPDLNNIDDPDYLALVKEAQRLSVNIRFNAGSAELDNKALQDVARLVAVMSQPEQQNKQLLLIGFGDAKQTTSRALILSKLRATAVKMALYNQGVGSAPVAGFGASMQVDGSNKERNQRVEVWLQ